jgi:hypothetical protein
VFGIPADRLRHAFVGGHHPRTPGALGATALVAVLILGGLKMWADRSVNQDAIERGEMPHHRVEWADLLATVGGAVVVFVGRELAGLVRRASPVHDSKQVCGLIPLACGGCDLPPNTQSLPLPIKSRVGFHCKDRSERSVNRTSIPCR